MIKSTFVYEKNSLSALKLLYEIFILKQSYDISNIVPIKSKFLHELRI